MTLKRNPENYFAEVEQSAFGTGVLVDGLDFSDDKMLQGRTFSYSDTQRYRVGPNYLQLPINAPKTGGHQPARWTNDLPCRYRPGENPHVNYEPSTLVACTKPLKLVKLIRRNTMQAGTQKIDRTIPLNRPVNVSCI